jgi:uroporphyrin-III C-methyltransferase
MECQHLNLGKVFLVGAGPGDPDLLTIKARDLIGAAGCVIYDHLVNPQILERAATDAELIYAGKERGKSAMQQETINALLIAKATEHRIVVRLKGGDPFVFGRGGEEALALVSAGVPWEVVPGVSSGMAAAACAGIPITHRGLGSSVAFVTGHEESSKTRSSINWDLLARSVDTLVILMGVGRAGQIADELLKHGRCGNTPAAVIRWGTYERQECHVGSLANLADLITERAISAPAIIVIGEVVRLRKQIGALGPSSDLAIQRNKPKAQRKEVDLEIPSQLTPLLL